MGTKLAQVLKFFTEIAVVECMPITTMRACGFDVQQDLLSLVLMVIEMLLF
jgi:hypothetical protein